MAEYLIQGETLTGIADAIRGKTGGTGPVAVSDMAAQIEGIQAGGGGSEMLDALIDRSITEISSNVTSIGTYAFSGCTQLTAADFPAATSIGSYAFQYCSQLTTVDFPVATSIGSYAFQYCSQLTTADFPVATSIGSYAFQYCSRLTTADFLVATSIGSSAFQQCSQLTTVDFPVATSIGNYAFQQCSQLTTVDFPVATSVGSSAFYSCSKLTAVILRSETMATLSSQNAFTKSAIASGTGYIYVPRALLSDTDETKDYRRATNWSTYANSFRALEDYTVDGTVTGELDPTKTGT